MARVTETKIRNSSLSDRADRILRALEANGLLLVSDAVFPNVTGLVAGTSVKGSWWGHPKGHDIWLTLEEIDEHPDIVLVKLVSGKPTFRLAGVLLALPGSIAAQENRGGKNMEIGHIHVGVRDLKSALAWFDNVLVWKPTYKDARIAILHPGPISLILDVSDVDVPATIALPSEDVDSDYEKLVKRGAVPLEHPSDMPYGVRAAYLQGPGKLKIEIEGPLKQTSPEKQGGSAGYSLS